jgi:hypothetical protein
MLEPYPVSAAAPTQPCPRRRCPMRAGVVNVRPTPANSPAPSGWIPRENHGKECSH